MIAEPDMTDTRTTTAMLDALRDPSNEEAWRAFVDRCEPILRGVALRMQVPSDEVADIVQTALASFLDAWRQGRYDRARGRLSTFLVTILRSRILDERRRRSVRFEHGRSAPLESGELDPLDRLDRLGPLEPFDPLDPRDPRDPRDPLDPLDQGTLSRHWATERHAQLLHLALVQLRNEGIEPRTVEAFELYALRGTPVAEVAALLAMTPEEIYSVKYRLTRRLRPLVARLGEIYEDI